MAITLRQVSQVNDVARLQSQFPVPLLRVEAKWHVLRAGVEGIVLLQRSDQILHRFGRVLPVESDSTVEREHLGIRVFLHLHGEYSDLWMLPRCIDKAVCPAGSHRFHRPAQHDRPTSVQNL